jgi:hypothetical protein
MNIIYYNRVKQEEVSAITNVKLDWLLFIYIDSDVISSVVTMIMSVNGCYS